jgi:serine/threonine-protein kinase
VSGDPRPDPRIGTTIGPYRIERVLGRGGMGVVYLAEHLHLERPVALKVLSDHLAHDDAFRERFVRESRMAARLRHPNIIPIYDAGEQDGVLFIAMQYVDGDDLAADLARGPLAPESALAILEPIASALDKAHASGIVHRDVKPANIMLGRETGADREIYLTDFGLVREIDRRSRLTRTGTFVGTLDYAAPEMFQNTGVDGKVDQYSLACVLYECCTGDVPFPRESEGALIAAHLADSPPPATTVRGDLPAELDAVIARGMAKAPEERYPTCSDLMRDAREALGAGAATPATPGRAPTVVAPPPPPLHGAPQGPAVPAASDAPPPPTRVRAQPGAPLPPKVPPERRPVWLFVLAGLVVVALIVGIVLAVSGGGNPQAGESPSTAPTGAGTTAPQTTPPATTRASVTPPPSSPPATSGPTESPVAPGPAPVVEDTVKVGQLPFGVARDADSVWVANQGSGTVSRIDPSSHRVIATKKGLDNAFEIAVGLGSVWVTDQQQTVYLLSPLGGKPQAIPMQGGAFGVTVGFGSVWVTNDKADTVTRLDRSGKVIAQIPTGDVPHGLTAGTDSIWVVGDTGSVTRIDPGTNRSVATVQVPTGSAFQVAEEAGFVWVTNGITAVVQIDPSDNRVVRTIPTPGGSFDVTGGFGSVWVTNANGNTLSRVDVAKHEVVDVVDVGVSPRYVAVGPEGLWVANGDSASVSLVHP